jgi:hypothetical protein
MALRSAGDASVASSVNPKTSVLINFVRLSTRRSRHSCRLHLTCRRQSPDAKPCARAADHESGVNTPVRRARVAPSLAAAQRRSMDLCSARRRCCRTRCIGPGRRRPTATCESRLKRPPPMPPNAIEIRDDGDDKLKARTTGRGPRASGFGRPRLAGLPPVPEILGGRSAARAPTHGVPRLVAAPPTRRPCARPPVWSTSGASRASPVSG